MTQRLRRTTWLCAAASATVSALGCGCAVIEVSSDRGCATYLVFGMARLSTDISGRPPMLAHVRHTEVGLYGRGGPAAGMGLGYSAGSAVYVDSGADATVEAGVDASGRHRVRVNAVRQKENPNEEVHHVVCLRDGLLSRRVREQ